MPAPPGPAIQALFMANFGGTLGVEGALYLTKLTNQISIGWQTWQLSCTFGNVAVTGAGSWIGVGNGGSLTAGTFKIPAFPFAADSPEQQKFTNAASKGIDDSFQKWVKSFKAAGLAYAGASTHSGSSPGGFTAVAVPTPIKTGSSGSYPSGTADLIKQYLTPPEFDLESPQSKAMDFVNGLAAAVEKSFKTLWILTTMLTMNSVSGPSASGSGSGVGNSLTNGKFL